MTQKPFNVSSWLTSNQKRQDLPGLMSNSAHSSSAPSTSYSRAQKVEGFNPTDYFTQGWKGDGLTSKATMTLKKVLDLLESDVQKQFQNQGLFNKSLKSPIYNEFLSYADSRALNCTDLDDYNAFWRHLYLRQSPYRKELDHFVLIYSSRVAIVYLFKIRLLSVLCKESRRLVEDKDILNPNSFFAQTFKKGSSTELSIESLQSNHYTWYRPQSSLIKVLTQLCELLPNITISEIQKILGQKDAQLNQQNFEKDTCQTYSHSLSHVNFGLFINSLLLKFPNWINDRNKGHQDPGHDLFSEFDKFQRYQPESHQNGSRKLKLPKVINCKFTGDHLSSLSLSHWLAQEKGTNKKWDQIICPDFNGSQFSFGLFMKISYELQFLCFLAQIAKIHDHHPVIFISHLIKEKNKRQVSNETQISMFEQNELGNGQLYDRVVLNLVDFPKNNPHFFLIHQIQSQYDSLRSGGLLYVLSNKKLFVPSQSDKVEQLLKKFKIESCWSLDKMKGKGEVSPFIYIFSKLEKRDQDNPPPFSPIGHDDESEFILGKKRPCLSFRLSGELTTFHKFSQVVEELNRFFKNRRVESTPLYQTELPDNLVLEFYQDAIVDGKLINSTKDSSKITHPGFFKNLMKACVPFDHFFTIEQLSHDYAHPGRSSSTYNILGLPIRTEDQYTILLIVDFKNPHQVRVELANMEAYKAKSQEYGFALCHYFGLIPKVPDINLNLFREFFNSEIGLQVIQLSLTGKVSKLKSKLKAVLVPKFFSTPLRIPTHVERGLELLSVSSKDILACDPRALHRQFLQIESPLYGLGQKYPWHVLGLLTHFKGTLGQSIELINDPHKQESLNFSNPIIRDALLKSKTRAIFPDNPDVYVEFKIKGPQELHLPLTKFQFCTQTKMGQTTYFIELISNSTTVAQIHADQTLLNFIRFILQNAVHIPISQILQGLMVPRTEDLKNILAGLQQLMNSLTDILSKVESIIGEVLKQQISFQQESELPLLPNV